MAESEVLNSSLGIIDEDKEETACVPKAKSVRFSLDSPNIGHDGDVDVKQDELVQLAAGDSSPSTPPTPASSSSPLPHPHSAKRRSPGCTPHVSRHHKDENATFLSNESCEEESSMDFTQETSWLNGEKPWWKSALEVVAVAHYLWLWILLPLVTLWFPFWLLFGSPVWWLVPLYAGWTWLDLHAPRRGSRCWTWYKRSSVWRHFADYFPIRLVKTAELPPNRNYIIGSHPHGVLSVGAFTSMLTEGTGFSRAFPGLQSTVLTLNGQFYFPLRRDIGIGLGGVESSRESLRWLLQNPGHGRAVAIVVGGSAEVLDAHPGRHELNLLSRRGFCRFALTHGASLVPMYHFGENDIFEQTPNPRGSKLRAVQTLIKNRFGFCPPLLFGRGLLTRWGMFPHRRPITTVVGAPIPVQKVDGEPSEEEVAELHARYCEALTELFETHKLAAGVAEDVHLELY